MPSVVVLGQYRSPSPALGQMPSVVVLGQYRSPSPALGQMPSVVVLDQYHSPSPALGEMPSVAAHGIVFFTTASQLLQIAPFTLVLSTITPLRHNLSAVVRHTVFRSARVIVTQIAVHAKS